MALYSCNYTMLSIITIGLTSSVSEHEKRGEQSQWKLKIRSEERERERDIIKAEKQLVEEYLNKLQGEGATDRTITSTMKDLGMKRFL
jgi:hypothetical protein